VKSYLLASLPANFRRPPAGHGDEECEAQHKGAASNHLLHPPGTALLGKLGVVHSPATRGIARETAEPHMSKNRHMRQPALGWVRRGGDLLAYSGERRSATMWTTCSPRS